MKKLILHLSVTFLFTFGAFAQWQISTDSTLQETVQDVSVANGNILLHDVGSNRGAIDLFDQNNAEYLRLYSSGGEGYIRMGGTNPKGIRFMPGNSQSVYFDTNGNVGIGTLTPAGKLDVLGQLRLSYNASTGTGGSINLDNPAGEVPAISMDQAGARWWQYVEGDNSFRIGRGSNYNSNAATMTLLGDYVGIGTTSPETELHILGSFTQTGDGIYIDNASKMNFVRNAYFDSSWKLSNNDEAEMIQMKDGEIAFFSTAQGTASSSFSWDRLMTIKQDGSVGIGTANPGHLLDVDGYINATGFKLNGQDLTLPGGDLVIGDITTPAARLDIRATNGDEIKFTDSLSSGNIVADQDLFLSAGGEINLGTGGAEKELVLSNGNLGIGNDSPLERLHVQGKMLSESSQPAVLLKETDNNPNENWRLDVHDGTFRLLAGNDSLNTWDAALNVTQSAGAPGSFLFQGSVGIGASNPTYALFVDGNNRLLGDLDVGDSAELTMGFRDNGGNARVRFAPRSVDGLSFASDNELIFDLVERAWSFDQQLGIGQNAPSATLDVASRIDTGSKATFALQGHGFTSKYWITSGTEGANHMMIGGVGDQVPTTAPLNIVDGKIGIATSDPEATLTVNGNILAEEVKVVVDVAAVPDYVFGKDYDLLSLEQIKAYVKANKHLPEVPSAESMASNGQDIGAMNLLLLKKIEELTLHAIDQKETIDQKSERISELEDDLVRLGDRLAAIEAALGINEND